MTWPHDNLSQFSSLNTVHCLVCLSRRPSPPPGHALPSSFYIMYNKIGKHVKSKKVVNSSWIKCRFSVSIGHTYVSFAVKFILFIILCKMLRDLTCGMSYSRHLHNNRVEDCLTLVHLNAHRRRRLSSRHLDSIRARIRAIHIPHIFKIDLVSLKLVCFHSWRKKCYFSSVGK